jgi:uncharacterized membrane protein
VWAGMMGWMLVFWIVVIVLALGLATWLFPAAPAADPASSARAILDARYARDEITQEQYRSMRREIGAGSPGAGRGAWLLIGVLILLALLTVVSFGGPGLYGARPGPGYPPYGMPHMWGR